jgi:hypothetical protein
MSDLEDAIELVRIGAGKVGYRSYPGTGGIWAGNNDGLADAVFVDWGWRAQPPKSSTPSSMVDWRLGGRRKNLPSTGATSAPRSLAPEIRIRHLACEIAGRGGRRSAKSAWR